MKGRQGPGKVIDFESRVGAVKLPIELPADVASLLHQRAQAAGLDPDVYIARMVSRHLDNIDAAITSSRDD